MRLASAIAFVLATVPGAMQCHALIRVALVISDTGYPNARVLPNPINDARDVTELRMVIAARALTALPLIRPTSPSCCSARQPNPGRGST
jgi:hypothetical protein